MTESFSGPFVITGLSGAGKSVLSRSLEDIGYDCVDNIPLELVPELFDRPAEELARLVVVLDVRAKGLAESFPAIHRSLSERFPRLRLVFVEASPETLLRRFSVVRRPHPFRDRSIEQAVADEQAALQGVRGLADLVVDTTHLTPHDLRRQVLSLAGIDAQQTLLTVEVQSFSYLQGVPPTASLVFDVRFLPNPYFVDQLRLLAGDDAPVVEWFAGQPEIDETMERLENLVGWLLPRYGAELKSDLLIAVGCTGGRHRSVYLTERLAASLKASGHHVVIHHRDKDRWR